MPARLAPRRLRTIPHHPRHRRRRAGADKVTDRLLTGDRFLLCSDGLVKTLPEPELARILAAAEDDLPVERLLRAALDRQADDNVTAVSVELLSDK
jgi:serine/threonine protein phosphatase PrpC